MQLAMEDMLWVSMEVPSVVGLMEVMRMVVTSNRTGPTIMQTSQLELMLATEDAALMAHQAGTIMVMEEVMMSGARTWREDTQMG